MFLLYQSNSSQKACSHLGNVTDHLAWSLVCSCLNYANSVFTGISDHWSQQASMHPTFPGSSDAVCIVSLSGSQTVACWPKVAPSLLMWAMALTNLENKVPNYLISLFLFKLFFYYFVFIWVHFSSNSMQHFMLLLKNVWFKSWMTENLIFNTLDLNFK